MIYKWKESSILAFLIFFISFSKIESDENTEFKIYNSEYESFTIFLNKGSRNCFYYIPKSKAFQIHFQVTKGGDYTIKSTISDPDNHKISDLSDPLNMHNEEIIVKDKFIGKGYRFCLDNRFSWQSKQVFISFDAGPDKTESSKHQLSFVESSLEKLFDNLRDVETNQNKFRAVEMLDRSIMESNYEYVTYWSMFQVVIMLITCMVQVVMIRSLFENTGVAASFWKSISNITLGYL